MEHARKAEPAGTLSTALAHAHRLLDTRPAMAEAQAREILEVMPGQPLALLLLASARRAQSDAAGAKAILESLAGAQPDLAPAHYALGSVLSALGEGRAAIAAFSRTTTLDPGNAAAWRALGDQLALAGDGTAANAAYARQIKASVNDPQLLEAASALCDNRLAIAERILRDFLKWHPTDIAAIRMLAETGARLGRYEDAEKLLARCLELAPGFAAARHNYATVLHRQMKSEEAVRQTDLLLKDDPRNPGYRALRAAALVRIAEYGQAIACYETLLAEYPEQPKAWMSYGHALKTVGRQPECLAAYRKGIALLPSLGEAYWSMANLKTFRFEAGEIAAMQAQLRRADLTDEDRYHLHFALGKALEDARIYAESFEHYAQGNMLRRSVLTYVGDVTSEHVRRSKEVFTAAFFQARKNAGSQAPDPIFIVGLPRAGSTLIEQILSSHSAVEGTMELPDVNVLARGLDGAKKKGANYPENLRGLEIARFAALGEEFLARARIQRKLGRPFFIDKMPNNFLHLGFIHLILPEAKIIDARRHPLGCCFSNFKQHFARGQTFTYDLTDIGRYYRDYVELMAHFDAVLPGRVHRVFYEDMIGDPEKEIRGLLDYCGLAFEESCLRFYENGRAVRTPSSEQVRRPIFTEAMEQWRSYETWLEPLKSALGPVLEAYPGVPVF